MSIVKAVIQRVKRCQILVEDRVISEIGKGVLILLGIEVKDTEETVKGMVKKITGVRIFNDKEGRMRLSIEELKGEYMVVSQITLCGDFAKGKRPSFDLAKKPDMANKLYEVFCDYLKKESGLEVKTGVFGARMLVKIENDGPVTFVIEQ
jgi:D-tyrosyl-tRNA(Tyr) deacylase